MSNSISAPGILLVSRFDEDLISVFKILNETTTPMYWYTTCADAVDSLEKHPIGVVVCDRDLPDGSWKDVLGALASMADAPPLIVTDRHVTTRFSAEVFSAGGYDVLTKPFDADEVQLAVMWAQERTATTRPAA